MKEIVFQITLLFKFVKTLIMKKLTQLEKMQSKSRTRNRRFEAIPYLGETYLVEEQKTYTPEEVKDVVRNLLKTTDFVDFINEHGISGWDQLENWLNENVK